MDAKAIRVKNLNNLLDQDGGDRSAFAQKLGYSDVNYFNQIVKGIGSFGDRTARKIEKALNLEHGYMDRVHDTRSTLGQPPSSTTVSVQGVPLLELSQVAKLPASQGDPYEVGKIGGFIQSNRRFNQNAFAIKVLGDSMVSQTNKSFPDGTTVVFEPIDNPVDGDLVVVAMEGASEVVFVKYAVRGNVVNLISLNSDYPPIDVTNTKYSVCGKAKLAITDL